MKGISKFFSMFLNIMNIIFVIAGIFAIFITVTTYGYNVDFVKGSREAVLVTQAVLSAPCLTVTAPDGYPVRGLFDETKLKEEALEVDPPSCIEYSQDIYIKLYGYGNSIEIGNSGLGTIKAVEYPAAIKKEDGNVTTATLLVYVEATNQCTKKDKYVCLTGEYGNEFGGGGKIYRGKCIEKDDLLVIDRETVENCNTDYFAPKSLVEDWYEQFGGDFVIKEDEYNVCLCQYFNDNAICRYGTETPTATYECSKVD